MQSQDRIFTYAEIAVMTRGWADKRLLQNRRAAKLWLAPIAEPGKGKPYAYRWPHVVEIIIAIELVRRGFTHESATGAIRNRLRAAFAHGKGGGWEVDFETKFRELPEIDGRECYWVMDAHDEQDWGLVAGAVLACWSASDAAEAIKSMNAGFVLNVSRVLQQARDRLPVEACP